MKPYLEISRLSYELPNSRELQRNLDLLLKPGEILVVSGPNGSGKTTFLKVILGQWKYFSGEFKWNVSRAEIQYLPQLENREVHFPITLSEVAGEGVALQDSDTLWNHASGGERKRTLLMRALSKKPRVLVLDEPFNHLDKEAVESLRRLIAEVPRGEEKPAVLIVCHRSEDYFPDASHLRFETSR